MGAAVTELLAEFLKLLRIIVESPDPPAAIERAKRAAMVDAANAAADDALRRMP